jgi:hypothetical protein
MIFDNLATQLSAEYELFLFALSGRYQQVRSPGIEVTPRAISELNYEAHNLAQTFYQLAERDIEEYLRPLLLDASDDLASGLVVRKKETLAHIRAMLLENVQTTMKLARTGMRGAISMLKGAHGAMGLLVQRKAGKIDFRVTDTSGRKWEARKLFAVIVRDFAYQAWIDHEVERLMVAGVDLVQTPNGRVMSLFGIGDYERFVDVRDNIFHINSKQIMVPYVPS